MINTEKLHISEPDTEKLHITKPEPKTIGICTDEAVLNGCKFCFCCLPTCPHYKLVLIDEAL